MKSNLYTASVRSFAKRMAAATAICGAFLTGASAQTYRSDFPTPTLGFPFGNFNFSQPAGTTSGLCGTVSSVVNLLAANGSIVNSSNVADADLNNYATLGNQALVGLNLSTLLGGCLIQPNYEIVVQLNLPTGMTAVPGGYYAGFVVEVPGAATVNLGSITTITTLLDGVEKESGTGTDLGISLLGGRNNIQFKTTAAPNNANDFNAVRIRMGSGVLNLSALTSPPRIYHGYANAIQILPVKLTSFAAANDGKGARLSWTSATETNLSHYDLERSTTANGKFEKVISINAKGNTTSATNYGFTDNTIVSSEYFYRLKMVDKDGLYEYSKVASVKNLVPSKYKVYPTLVSKGENITVAMDNSGAVKADIQLTNLQGQVVKTITTTNANITIATGNLTTGVYVLKLYRNGQLATTEKLVIQ